LKPQCGSVKQLTGVFALSVISKKDPTRLWWLGRPPVVVGAHGEYLWRRCAAIFRTRAICFLADGDMAI
jgi:glucosamine 6-phosphate synthetase-like amidotransferase/phosphosugar isomerase protein